MWHGDEYVYIRGQHRSGAESGIHDCLILQLLLVIVNAAFSVTVRVRVKCLQCFDTVGWAAGRASDL